MRMIYCRGCGKHYDYDKTDFCPKCGAYNAPSSSTAKLVPPTPQPNPAQQSRPVLRVQQPPVRVQPVPRPPQVGPRQVYYTTPAAWQKKGSGQKRSILAITLGIVATIVMTTVVAMAFQMAGVTSYFTAQSTPKPDLAQAVEPASGDFWHETWEGFALNSVTVSIEDSWLIGLSPSFRYAREGYDCLAVDVWITNGTRQSDLVIDTPRVQLSDGTQIPLEDDPFFARELRTKYSVYAVSLRDYQWEDPLFGSFVFFVPEGETDFTLVVSEYAPGDPEGSAPRASHYIPLTLLEY